MTSHSTSPTPAINKGEAGGGGVSDDENASHHHSSSPPMAAHPPREGSPANPRTSSRNAPHASLSPASSSLHKGGGGGLSSSRGGGGQSPSPSTPSFRNKSSPFAQDLVRSTSKRKAAMSSAAQQRQRETGWSGSTAIPKPIDIRLGRGVREPVERAPDVGLSLDGLLASLRNGSSHLSSKGNGEDGNGEEGDSSTTLQHFPSPPPRRAMSSSSTRGAGREGSPSLSSTLGARQSTTRHSKQQAARAAANEKATRMVNKLFKDEFAEQDKRRANFEIKEQEAFAEIIDAFSSAYDVAKKKERTNRLKRGLVTIRDQMAREEARDRKIISDEEFALWQEIENEMKRGSRSMRRVGKLAAQHAEERDRVVADEARKRKAIDDDEKEMAGQLANKRRILWAKMKDDASKNGEKIARQREADALKAREAFEENSNKLSDDERPRRYLILVEEEAAREDLQRTIEDELKQAILMDEKRRDEEEKVRIEKERLKAEAEAAEQERIAAEEKENALKAEQEAAAAAAAAEEKARLAERQRQLQLLKEKEQKEAADAAAAAAANEAAFQRLKAECMSEEEALRSSDLEAAEEREREALAKAFKNDLDAIAEEEKQKKRNEAKEKAEKEEEAARQQQFQQSIADLEAHEVEARQAIAAEESTDADAVMAAASDALALLLKTKEEAETNEEEEEENARRAQQLLEAAADADLQLAMLSNKRQERTAKLKQGRGGGGGGGEDDDDNEDGEENAATETHNTTADGADHDGVGITAKAHTIPKSAFELLLDEWVNPLIDAYLKIDALTTSREPTEAAVSEYNGLKIKFAMALAQFKRANPFKPHAIGGAAGGAGGAHHVNNTSSYSGGSGTFGGSLRRRATLHNTDAALLLSTAGAGSPPPQTSDLTQEEKEYIVRRRRATRRIRPFFELLVRDTDANRPNVTLMSTLLTDNLPIDFARIIREDDLLSDAAIDGSVSYFDSFLGVPALRLQPAKAAQLMTLALSNPKKRILFAETIMRREYALSTMQLRKEMAPMWQRFLFQVVGKMYQQQHQQQTATSSSPLAITASSSPPPNTTANSLVIAGLDRVGIVLSQMFKKKHSIDVNLAAPATEKVCPITRDTLMTRLAILGDVEMFGVLLEKVIASVGSGEDSTSSPSASFRYGVTAAEGTAAAENSKNSKQTDDDEHHHHDSLIQQFGDALVAPRPSDGATPLILAIEYNHLPFVHLLLQFPHVRRTIRHSETHEYVSEANAVDTAHGEHTTATALNGSGGGGGIDVNPSANNNNNNNNANDSNNNNNNNANDSNNKALFDKLLFNVGAEVEGSGEGSGGVVVVNTHRAVEPIRTAYGIAGDATTLDRIAEMVMLCGDEGAEAPAIHDYDYEDVHDRGLLKMASAGSGRGGGALPAAGGGGGGLGGEGALGITPQQQPSQIQLIYKFFSEFEPSSHLHGHDHHHNENNSSYATTTGGPLLSAPTTKNQSPSHQPHQTSSTSVSIDGNGGDSTAKKKTKDGQASPPSLGSLAGSLRGDDDDDDAVGGGGGGLDMSIEEDSSPEHSPPEANKNGAAPPLTAGNDIEATLRALGMGGGGGGLNMTVTFNTTRTSESKTTRNTNAATSLNNTVTTTTGDPLNATAGYVITTTTTTTTTKTTTTNPAPVAAALADEDEYENLSDLEGVEQLSQWDEEEEYLEEVAEGAEEEEEL